MKIAFLIEEIHPNAGQTYTIAEIIKYLLSSHEDWEISVLTQRIYRPLVGSIGDKRVKLIKLNQYYSAMIISRKLSKILKEYDVLYVKGSFPYVFPSVRSGKPTILVVHQMDSPKMFKRIIPKIRILAANLMTGYVIKKADAVVTVTDELASFYERKYGVKMSIIEDQISDRYYNSPARGVIKDGETLKLLTVGNWDGFNGRKRQHVLLGYLAEAVKTLPDIHLTISGLSDINMKELNDLVVKLNLNKHVSLKGYMTDDELLSEYLNNQIYVTATTYEGFYRQVVEGFATGMPALVYDSRDFVKDSASAASVNHVLKSGAGDIYKDAETFQHSLINITKNYAEYSIKAVTYAKKFSSQELGGKTAKLIYNVSIKNSNKNKLSGSFRGLQ